MTELTPELLDEIKRHLAASPMRHGEIFRHMDTMTVEEMASAVGRKSVAHQQFQAKPRSPTGRKAAGPALGVHGDDELLCVPRTEKLHTHALS